MIAIQTTKNYKSPWLEIKASVKMRGRTLCTASRAAPRWTQLLLYYFCWDKTLRISSRGDNPQWAQLYQGERGSWLLFRNADAMKTRAKELSRWKLAPKSSEASTTYGYKLEPAAQRGKLLQVSLGQLTKLDGGKVWRHSWIYWRWDYIPVSYRKVCSCS